MKKMNGSVKSVIVLTVICLIVTVLLALTNSVTKPVIDRSRAEKVNSSLKVVLPDSGTFTEVELPEGVSPVVKKVFKAEDGSYAVVLATRSSYSSDDMGITVGIDPEGRIKGITLTSYKESKDFGKDTYPQNYLEKDSSNYTEVDSFAGVTYSSKALKEAIGHAFEAVEMIKGGEA
ncbi:MAG: FMN-binding protein [Clostridia bacterium]|nr:FMN-binding protein [Clostridia bacterium]